MFRNLFACALVASVSSVAAPALAQDGELRPFCPDRPGKGDSTCIVDQGHLQLEVGLFDSGSQRDDASEAESLAVGTIVVRYGLGPLTEVQAGITAWQEDEVTDRATGVTDRVSGRGDMFLAARHSLLRPDGGGFGAAISAYVSLPTGDSDVRASGVEADFALPLAYDLGNDWGLAVSPIISVARDADGEGSHAAYTLVVGVGRPVGQWSLGTELWVSEDDDPLGSTTQSTVNLLAAWSPPFMADAQLDFGLNFGLNDDSPDVEFGVGIARRF